jgi:hypothetical protein
MIEIRWQKTVSVRIKNTLAGSDRQILTAHRLGINEMDRVTAQLRACVETSGLY